MGFDTEKYIPEICAGCTQHTTTCYSLAKGTALTVLAMAKAIENKGINIIHAAKEMMEVGLMTPNQRANLKCAEAHGLIEHYDGEAGNWKITDKTMRFLGGEPIPKFAIYDKILKSTKEYWQPETTVTLSELLQSDEYWEGVNFTIVEGQIITK
jgi:hypothetical protein